MAAIDIEKVIAELNRRFSMELPEFYNRRIIFWQDEDREFEDVIGDIEIEGVKILQLTGTNHFDVKKTLTVDDIDSDYLVYCPLSYDRLDDDWLINIKLYSEEFRSDLNSIWIDEMGLAVNPIIRKSVKEYRKFFNAKDRRNKVAVLSKNISTAPHMHLAVMSVICNLDNMQPNSIIRAVLNESLDISENEIYKQLENYNAVNAFWAMVYQGTGYRETENPDLKRLAAHIVMTALTRTMRIEYLTALSDFISEPHQIYCYDLVTEWLCVKENQGFYEIVREIEEELRLADKIANTDLDDMISSELLPCINEQILLKLTDDIKNNLLSPEYIKSVIAKRRPMAWYEETKCYFEAIDEYANILKFYQAYPNGFHTMEPDKLWKEYTDEYYKMDQYYRYFQTAYSECMKVSNLLLHDAIEAVAAEAENLYQYWYLDKLLDCWTRAAEEQLESSPSINGIISQEKFYDKYVRGNDKRTYVIISDALRYEVAATLTEELRREMQCKVKLNSCQTVFPASTKFGMAALLPHRKLSVELGSNNKIKVYADDKATESANRDAILKDANPKSVALKYEDIISLKRAERSELVKGMEVVYIYHDKIDKISHTSDAAVCPACEDAITEIKNIIKIICNDFGGTNICITADHGFIYTREPFKGDIKVDKSTVKDEEVEVDERYIIVRAGAKPENMIPVHFMNKDIYYEAFAPRGIYRIPRQGQNGNYLHGGISLQELVIPVIEFAYLRNTNKSYQLNKDTYDTKPVEISILSSTRKISNMIFTLDFYQKDAVSHNREAAEYSIYMADIAGRPVSDIQTIIADKASTNNQERTYHCTFNLKPVQFEKTATYYIVIEEKKGKTETVREEFQIDIAFAVDDFNFFN